MWLRSLIARDVPSGIRRARELFGDSVLIVDTEPSETGVRITVAMEHEDGESFAREGESSPRPLPGNVPPRRPSSATPIGALDAPLDVLERIRNALDFHGVPAALAERIVRMAEEEPADDPAATLGLALERTFRFRPLRFERPGRSGHSAGNGRRLMLVGPPGSGKTVTVAKLAASALAAGTEVVVVTTDLGSAGAVERLRTFTDALEVPLYNANEPEALARHLATQAAGTVVLIDTAPMDPFAPADLAEVASFAEAAGAEATLIIPASIAASEACEIAITAGRIGATRLIPTQLDLAQRLGGVLRAAEAGRLAFAEGGIGRSVGKGLHALTPLALARLVLHAARGDAVGAFATPGSSAG